MAFGKFLQGLREKAGLSQSGLAKKAGIPIRTIHGWEQGRRIPRLRMMPLLAEALGVDVADLLRAAVEPAEEPKKKRKKRGQS